MKVPKTSDESEWEPPDDTVTDFHIDVDEIGMGDIDVGEARPLHIKVAQKAVYFQNNPFRAASLKREREYTERVAAFLLSKSEMTYVLLIRSGDKEDGNGRTFYVAQHSDVLDLFPQLVDDHGFEFTSINSSYLLDDLPDSLSAEFEDGDTSENAESGRDGPDTFSA